MKSINSKDTKKMILIFGLAHEKKIKEFMEPFKGMFDATIYVPLQNRKYVRPEEIIKNGKELGLDIIFEPSLQEGLNSIDKSQDLRVLICGSLSLVAEAKKIN
jgi:folylpolyglutamate synthase/dihydropteroate synthase